jgi:hypothetical protein
MLEYFLNFSGHRDTLVVAPIEIVGSQLTFFIAFNFNNDDPAHKPGYDDGSSLDHRGNQRMLS